MIALHVAAAVAQPPGIPAAETGSTAAIASFINRNYNSESRKLYAIYSWVSSNISYDADSANIINMGPDPEARITAALRRRRGVCENYAAIFNDICSRSGLASFVVDGYTKQNGEVDKVGHSWCCVRVDGQWQLCDPTWDAGKGSTRWLMMPPSEMIETHMPYDPMWQLLQQTVSHRRFATGAPEKEQKIFNYSDTIAKFMGMDSLQRYRSIASRMAANGLYNSLIRDRYNYVKMHIEIIREDRDVALYDSAVALLNAVAVSYNNFIQFRNNQFLLAVSDHVLEKMLEGLEEKITNAQAHLDRIEKTEASFTFSTEAPRNKLQSLALKVREQKAFLRSYLSTAKDKRTGLFFTHKTIADSK